MIPASYIEKPLHKRQRKSTLISAHSPASSVKLSVSLSSSVFASLTRFPVYNTVLVCKSIIRTRIQLTSHSAWIAWFPVLFYSTIYVGDLHKRTSPPANSLDEQNALDTEATRLGSRALFFSALLSLFVNLTLPLFVSESAGTRNGRPVVPTASQSWFERACRVPRGMQVHLATLWAVSHIVFAGCMFATLCVGLSFRFYPLL